MTHTAEPTVPGTVVRATTRSFFDDKSLIEVVAVLTHMTGEHHWQFISLSDTTNGTRAWDDLIDSVVVYVPNIPSTNG